MTRIRLGISTCPNDTYAFHGLLTGQVESDIDFDISLHDVEELNRGIHASAFDVAKGSFAAVMPVTDRWGVLPSGSALGFGVGPVMLSGRPEVRPGTPVGDPPRRPTILTPGFNTTAAMLYRMFYVNQCIERHVVFHEIMPALQAGEADLGVCIHEGRFTYEAAGLHLVEDLGASWEARTGAPLPLGGIFARRDLPPETIRAVQQAVRSSLDLARSDPSVIDTMRAHAQELDDDVIWRHVELYVNEWTYDLGDVGDGALQTLHREARDAGLFLPDTEPLTIVGR